MMEWDSPAWRELRNAKLYEWFLGNEDAVNCAVALSTAVETWDDLIDKDKPVSPADINQAFTLLLVDLPANQFYVNYRHYIEPWLVLFVNAWMDSEQLRQTSDTDAKLQAFFLRNLSLELIPLIAFCCGGFENMRKISLEAREFYRHESFDDWKLEG